MTFDQREFDIRFEWGEHGVATLAPVSEVVIIVDVLSFSTCVDIAVQRGAKVYPFPWRDERAGEYAASLGGILADPRRSKTAPSLSPVSLLNLPAGAGLVLPSPNGASLTWAVKDTPVLAGCFRNAEAVALAASQYGRKIGVIAAGERWKEDHSLRPAFEDLSGAGAVIHSLKGSLSPEAASALACFREIQAGLGDFLKQCSSGKELIERGFAEDVALAAQLNVSECAPVFVDRAYISMKGIEDKEKGEK